MRQWPPSWAYVLLKSGGVSQWTNKICKIPDNDKIWGENSHARVYTEAKGLPQLGGQGMDGHFWAMEWRRVSEDHLEEFSGRGNSTGRSPEGRENWGVEGARSLLKPRAERGQDWVIRVGWMPSTDVLHAALTCSTEPVSSRQEFWEPVVKQSHY